MSSDLINRIDELLPQTQCGECGYGACLPYAEAIAQQGEALNLCPPGGVKTLTALGKLMQQDISAYEAQVAANTRPPEVAYIREDLCIGCTKCITACPVDAIVGAGKLMHTVITDDCTGCRLCIEPCPMDCIDLLPIERTTQEQQQQAQRSRARYQRHQTRLKGDEKSSKQQHQQAKQAQKSAEQSAEEARQAYIANALARVKAKKSS